MAEMTNKGQIVETVIEALIAFFIIAIFIGTVGPALYDIDKASGGLFVFGALIVLIFVILGVLRR